MPRKMMSRRLAQWTLTILDADSHAGPAARGPDAELAAAMSRREKAGVHFGLQLLPWDGYQAA